MGRIKEVERRSFGSRKRNPVVYLICEGSVLCAGTSDFLVNDEQARKLYLGENFSM